jgi:orotate phosphoribosyltransferase
MTEVSATSFYALTSARRGHFQLESGHHSELWLDLDGLFSNPDAIAPLVSNLTEMLRPHNVSAVCGPLLGGAFLAQLLAHALGVNFYFTERHLPVGATGLYRASYHLPPAFRESVRGQRIAIVDDVMSAGSALRGTYNELQQYGAVIAVAGALMVFGNTGSDFFRERNVAVAATVRDEYTLWQPDACPLCRQGVPLENVATAAS